MSALIGNAVFRRLDREALSQLCAEVARLAVENEELRQQLWLAEDAACAWQEDAMNLQQVLCQATGGHPGLTVDGALVVVPSGEAPAEVQA
ncbi:hypothetical protein DCO49_03990 [Stenotrophomonas sp. SPM]|uniref:hypothetical protein n=1 Tax=Stenotrophomonas sp. SPM TaxID=2170735 RepID=UPI000DE6B63A|nr:hypothetical protein [Stenotrophomonas sp. SPM]PWB28876.1 hypothetical protein DCO49_03990 [Stenotrophomonas sp. SPM]